VSELLNQLRMLREIYPHNENILKIYGLACEQSEKIAEGANKIKELERMHMTDDQKINWSMKDRIQELEKENEWLFDFALGYTNSTFINESLQALKESNKQSG
jgi:hypothetical protein